MGIKKWNTIAVMSKNKVIGKKNFIPFNIPLDRLWFKTKTYKKTIIFGRKTFENIKALNPNNNYLVLTKQKNFKVFEKNIKIIDTLEKIKNSDDVWICGGEAIYSQTLKNCKFLFLTTVKKNYNGDKHFPNFKDDFILEEKIFENEELCIEKYKNKKAETE